MALADCTGHGVPGSFMTLLGINLLNNIVLEQRNFNAGSILNQLDEKLVQALPREFEDGNMTDGMEITVCVFNHKTKELSYACAGSRFLLFESNIFTMLKGDTKHIGDIPVTEFKGYITHYRKFNDNTTLFLITDGFQDQFGGEKDKKYSFRRMIELFESNIRLPLSEQELIIEREFKLWKGNFEQTDDITILILRNLY
jgi:serine phosphatase RsbU (regulator of sigma subunit)